MGISAFYGRVVVGSRESSQRNDNNEGNRRNRPTWRSRSLRGALPWTGRTGSRTERVKTALPGFEEAK